jgi:hypothetical protein
MAALWSVPVDNKWSPETLLINITTKDFSPDGAESPNPGGSNAALSDVLCLGDKSIRRAQAAIEQGGGAKIDIPSALLAEAASHELLHLLHGLSTRSGGYFRQHGRSIALTRLYHWVLIAAKADETPNDRIKLGKYPSIYEAVANFPDKARLAQRAASINHYENANTLASEYANVDARGLCPQYLFEGCAFAFGELISGLYEQDGWHRAYRSVTQYSAAWDIFSRELNQDPLQKRTKGALLCFCVATYVAIQYGFVDDVSHGPNPWERTASQLFDRLSTAAGHLLQTYQGSAHSGHATGRRPNRLFLWKRTQLADSNALGELLDETWEDEVRAYFLKYQKVIPLDSDFIRICAVVKACLDIVQDEFGDDFQSYGGLGADVALETMQSDDPTSRQMYEYAKSFSPLVGTPWIIAELLASNQRTAECLRHLAWNAPRQVKIDVAHSIGGPVLGNALNEAALLFHLGHCDTIMKHAHEILVEQAKALSQGPQQLRHIKEVQFKRRRHELLQNIHHMDDLLRLHFEDLVSRHRRSPFVFSSVFDLSEFA